MATARESVVSSMPRKTRPRSATTQRSHPQVVRDRDADRSLHQALGWFSIGLGVVEVLAPRTLGRFIGVGEKTAMLRVCGAREIISGVSLLSERAPAVSAFSRVAGDAMDLALLGTALRSRDANPARIAAAATAVLGVAAVDVYAAGRGARAQLAATPENTAVRVSVAIKSTPEKLYGFWRELENLPQFIDSLESVTSRDAKVSHWVVRAPGGARLEWDAELVDDRPNELLAWRTLPGAAVRHHGDVRFERAPGEHGTIVHVHVEYGAPGGALGATLAKLAGGAPELQIKRHLRALKQLLETGEIATTRGQASGARSLLGKTMVRKAS